MLGCTAGIHNLTSCEQPSICKRSRSTTAAPRAWHAVPTYVAVYCALLQHTMQRCSAARRLCALLCVSSLLLMVVGLPLEVVELTGSSFERQTQASTGQTTGRW
jgi:hypothetical protein